KNKDLGERFNNFQPIYILNDKESYEACFDQSSELNFVFLHKKKRKFQIFEQLNIKDLTAYYEGTINNIIESVNSSLQLAMVNPNQNWAEEQKNLEKNIIDQLQLLKDQAKKNIKKNEMKRRVSRLSVINLIYDHPKQNLYLKRLSDLAKMSPRSLQTNFLNSYDISPTHFHKFVRLTAVNHQLKIDEPRTNQVTRIAISHGFTHLGQFSCDYKRYFKESPSDTLYSDAV
ncbi:MAG: AraC family transcriptional regulator, partial [Gammaproteobacteria bacterium]|nr:AraC family transcriptional regulator [Gammaproteobacteria bacterium]